ncbi:MAG TPA: DUF4056 domain-containing protein [Bacteriovoracaceae bacterium]|nr:DUF4056 domain-containing protein [Bacteriovoracaceae bacterium]
MKFLFIVSILLGSLQASASFEGLDAETLKNSSISFFTRPCCSFANSFIQHKVGLAGLYLDPSKLGEHRFARIGDEDDKEDKVGLIYTCKGGFIDVSHVRDTADWAAHILYNLSSWIGSGREVLAREEGSFETRGVYFPKLTTKQLTSLSKADLADLAVAISNSMALLHEIPTSFNIQKGSAFSVEDAYSNLLGSYLGVRAAQGPLPFNRAMSEILLSELSELGSMEKKKTVIVHKMVKNLWWKSSFSGGFDSVLKRDFTFEDDIRPFRVDAVPYCQSDAEKVLKIPAVLSNGRSVNEYFQIRGQMKEHFFEKLAKIGVHIQGPLTQEHYPEVIQGIRSHFARKLGETLDQN